MKIKSLILSSLIVLSIPTQIAAIINETAGVLTGISGLLGAVIGANLCHNPKNDGSAGIGAIVVGASTALIGGYIFYSYTPESRLEEAKRIKRFIQKNRLITFRYTNQFGYILAVKQIYLRYDYPIYKAYEDLIELQDKLSEANSLLKKALNDTNYNLELIVTINEELEDVAILQKIIQEALFCLKYSPEFKEQQVIVQQIRLKEESLRIEQEKAAQFARQAAAQEEANRIKWAKLHSKN